MFKIADVTVTHLTHDSREVKPGSCFFALRGTEKNGLMYIRQAVAKGAAIIVSEEKLDESVPNLVVPNVREFMSLAAKRFHGNVCDKMKIIGVTGTNGKTTCAHMLKHILGKKSETIGTLGPGKLTTPDPIELHEILASMYRAEIRTVIMEVSAHAIHYYKIAGITFCAAVFTNLSRDHLDFFETMDQYAGTKIKFFGAQVKTAIINMDDEYGRQIEHPDIVPYSLGSLKNLHLTPCGSSFSLGRHKFHVNIAGRFNVSNALACIHTARMLGVRYGKIARGLKNLPPVPGRFNVIKVKDFSVIIDFAHTPDGLEQILTSCREFIADGGRLVAVFGCGGNRDRSKREIMGEIAGRLSDFAVVTSDNPRDESSMAIMLQIEAGIKTVSEDKSVLIENRKDAIKHALDMCACGDVVVIAGKGAETAQEIAGNKIPFCDADVVKQYISGCIVTHNKKA